MKVKATVLCENYVLWHHTVLGEHGFSVFLETDSGNWLWDTGNGKTILHNAAALGLDLKTVKGIVLSHNHWDHTGGLLPVAQACAGVEVFAHPALFRETHHTGDEAREPLGIPHTREELEAAGASFHFSADFREIAPSLWLTGEVPRVTEFETGGMRQMIRTADGDMEDDVSDDQSAVIETEKGLVVVLGCCHSGLINTLTCISEKLGTRRFHAVFGGTHLAPASRETRTKVLRALGDFDIERIGVSHCSGLEIAAPLAHMYGDRFSYFGVGTVLEA
jgi:7,8-dihydropterin-6-yl-methyl-4-(beta-D-ribofuranosyl)aminobenzene 5'-phosphate synthase